MTGAGGWAKGFVRLASRIVPADQRTEWRAEWEAELWEAARRGGRSSLGFALGSLRHALWLWRREWTLDLLLGDAKQAVRGLVRAPGFVAASALTLALGIGANAIVFTLLNGLVLRAPAGVAAPGELVQIGRGEAPQDFDTWSAPYIDDLRASTGTVLSGLAAWSDVRGILGRGLEARAIAVQLVSGEYFDVLGVRPEAGRLLRPEDDGRPGGRTALVLSHAVWKSAFGGDPAVVGSEVVLNGQRWQVAGIAPAGFTGVDPFRNAPGAWAPLSMQAALTGRPDAVLADRGNNWLWTFARRAPGVGGDRAAVAVRAAHARIARAHPAVTESGILVVEGVGARPAERSEVLRLGAILMATMLVVLAIACANLAGLTLARGAARRGEMAVRVALGASRRRLVRQLVLESLGVAVLGAAVAAALVAVLSSALPGLVPLPVAADFSPDARVLGFTAGIALLTVLAVGVAPALVAARADPLHALRTSGVGRGSGAGSSRLRRGLVVVQVALAFVLLAGAALLVRSVRAAYTADAGFRTSDVLAVTVDVGRSLNLETSARAAVRSRLLDRLARVPGVTSVGTATVLPIAEPQPNRTPLGPGELPVARTGPPPPPVYTNTVDGGYFRVLGLRPVAGRLFDDAVDGPAAAPVIVVNQAFAARFFPAGDAVGGTVRWAGDEAAPPTIIGVVEDAPIRALGERPPAALYSPVSRQAPGTYHLLVAVDRDVPAIRSAVAAAVADVEPLLPILRMESLDRLVGGSLARTRLTAVTAGAAGSLALLLAVVGVYGVIACAVADRRREFGLRFALGARGRDVLRLVLRQGAGLAAAGIGIGLALALATLRVLEGMLFGVSPGDPATLAAIAVILGTITVAASAIPALRATRTDPARTLDGA